MLSNNEQNMLKEIHEAVQTICPDEKVEGPILASCVDEFCRRIGWQEAQKLALAPPQTVEAQAEEEMPF